MHHLSQSISCKGQKLAQCAFGILIEVTFNHVCLTAVMKMVRKRADRLPSAMGRIVITVNRTVKRAALPVITVTIDQLQGEPDIHKAAIREDQEFQI